MVVLFIVGVVKEVPVAIEEPPLAAVYQFKVVPELPVAPNVTVPVPHLVAPVVLVTELVNVTWILLE